MTNPINFKLPTTQNTSFALSDWPYPPNVDPAFILRYFREDLIQPAVGAYLNYMTKLSTLEADAARARADLLQNLAKIQHG